MTSLETIPRNPVTTSALKMRSILKHQSKRRTTARDREIGRMICEARKLRCISQSELGTAIGISFQQIQKIENGHNRISLDRLERIAEKLAVPVSHFFRKSKAITVAPEHPAYRLVRSKSGLRALNALAKLTGRSLGAAAVALELMANGQ